MNARQFVEAFEKKIEEVKPPGFGGEYSGGIYRVLEKMGEDAGFEVRHKNRGGELNFLDFAYLPKGKPYPVVIIEHENEYKREATAKDFKKLCYYDSSPIPLRVMIGYQREKKDALVVGWQLTHRDYAEWKDLPPNSETLLIMGWRMLDVDAPDEWHYWLKCNQNDWKEQRGYGPTKLDFFNCP